MIIYIRYNCILDLAYMTKDRECHVNSPPEIPRQLLSSRLSRLTFKSRVDSVTDRLKLT